MWYLCVCTHGMEISISLLNFSLYSHSFIQVPNVINFADFFLGVSLCLQFPLPSLNSSACLCPLWGHRSFLSENFGSFCPAFYLLAPLSSVGEELSFWGSHVALLYFTCVYIIVCTSSGKSSGFIWESSCWAAYSVSTPTERGSKCFSFPSLP